jgi:hypothetical protein
MQTCSIDHISFCPYIGEILLVFNAGYYIVCPQALPLSTFFCRTMLPKLVIFLCPFAVYYLRYAVRSFFTLSRISLADGKRAGQKIQRKIAAAVQKVKSPVLFIPLF